MHLSLEHFKRIGVIGSRRRDSIEDYRKVYEAIISVINDYKKELGYHPHIILISGGAYRGADKFAETIAKELGLSMLIYRPEYKRYSGRLAPLIRNTLIANDSDVLIACVTPDRKGGTEDCVGKFKLIHPESKLILVT